MGKKGLVIGANGGLGSACAQRMVEYGWQVFLGCRNLEKATQITDSLGAGTPIVLDLTQPETIETAMQLCGPLDGLVQAAGPHLSMEYVSRMDPQELALGLQLETIGFLRVVQTALPGIRERRGRIVALSSAGLAKHPSLDIASTVPKAGVEAIIRGLAVEEGKYGVRANSVAVGVVEAGMFERLRHAGLSAEWQAAALRNIPLQRFGTAQDVAEAVCFLLSDKAKYITGQRLTVDGGYST